MLTYIWRPQYISFPQYTIKEFLVYIFYSYLLTVFFIALSGLLIIYLDPILSKLVASESILSDFRQVNRSLVADYGYRTFFIVCVVAPIIEEAIFRLPLTLKTYGFPISLGIIFYRFSGGNFFQISFENHVTYLRFLGTFLMMYSILKFQRKRWLELLQTQYFNQLFWLSALTFGLVHISNNPAVQFNLLPLYIIYVLPQIIMGLFLGAVQANRGYWAAVILHCMLNLMTFVF